LKLLGDVPLVDVILGVLAFVSFFNSEVVDLGHS
jgi:hypothetical protein